jgi:hypothetical protein
MVFDQFLDLHVFMQKLPVGKSDVEGLEGGDGDDGFGLGDEGGGEVEWCYVLEVLKDECPKIDILDDNGQDKEGNDGGRRRGFGKREGSWIPLIIEGGTEFRSAFGRGKGS